MASSNLTFKLFGKDVSASKAFKGLERNANGLQGKFGGLGSAMSGVATVAATVAAAAVAVGVALYDAAQAAAEDQKSSALLAKTLKATTKATDAQVASVEDWIDTTQRAVGVADDELRPALAQLVRSTKDVHKAQGLLNLALDISAGTGRDLQSVSIALSKAYGGNVSGLAKLGIQTKDAHGKTLAFDGIVKQLTKTFGGQAATAADTYDGKMKRLGISFDEIKESLGYQVLPYLTQFADWMLKDGIPALERMGRTLGEWLVPIIDQVKSAFADMSQTVAENKQFFEDLKTVAIPLAKVALANLAIEMRGLSVVMKAVAVVGSFFDRQFRAIAITVGVVVSSVTGMVARFKVAFNNLATAWNSSFAKWSWDLPPALGGGHIGFPQMPHLANGGIVTRPTVALIGEAGPEAVVPLRGGRGVGSSIVVNVNSPLGTPQQVGRAVLDAVRQAQGSGRAVVNF